MTAHPPPRARSAKSAHVEARRRLAERLAQAEEVLGAYLAAGDDIGSLRAAITQAERRQADALATLAGLVGRSQAAGLAGVDEPQVRAALARRKAHADAPDQSAALDGHSHSPITTPAPNPVPRSPVSGSGCVGLPTTISRQAPVSVPR